MGIMNACFFRDNQHPSIEDRNLLCGFLQKYNIPVEGHFQNALEDNSGPAWRYPAFAVKYYPSDPVLIEKLRLLCQSHGKDKNDIERNYQNQLVEFHALYVCAALMGYQFDGWDKPSEKSGVAPQKNCDLAFIKDRQRFFADAKDVSSEILSQYEDPRHPDMIHFTPKIELTAWLKKQIGDVKKQGADFLICHTPGWGLTSFDEPIIKQWLDSILPNTLIWSDEGPVWQIDFEGISQIIIIKDEGCLKIRVAKR